MWIKEKLYMMAKDHGGPEAERLVEVVEEEGDIDSVNAAKEEFLNVLALENRITREDYEELNQLECDTVLTEDDEENTESVCG